MSENLSKENLLDEVRRLAEELDKIPSSIDMRENGKHHPSTYQTHFRSWSDAVEEAGFEPNHGTKISTSDLINDIQRVASDLGRCPSSSEIRDYGEFSYPTYHNRFGSWSKAVGEAGFEPGDPKPIPRERLLRELNDLFDELDGKPTTADMRERGAYSDQTYRNRFGSWSSAIEAARDYTPSVGKLSEADDGEDGDHR